MSDTRVTMYVPPSEFNHAFRWEDDENWKTKLMLKKLPVGKSSWADEDVETAAESLAGFYTTDGERVPT